MWLFDKAGLPTGGSAVLVAIMLFATNWAETHLPDRSAEITDYVTALLIGAVTALLENETKRERVRIAGT